MKVSEAYFDQVVNENIEDFGMDHEEAVKDAIQQFLDKGDDVSFLLISNDAKSSSDKFNERLRQLDGLILEHKASASSAGNDELVLTSINAIFVDMHYILSNANHNDTTKENYAKALSTKAIENGALGAIIYCITAMMIHVPEINLGYRILKQLISAGLIENKEIIPQEGFQAVVAQLGNSEKISESGWEFLCEAIRCSEKNKTALKEAGVDDLIRKYIKKNENIEVVCAALKIYVSDDDRREGVHPGTFVRARKLCENKADSVIIPLLNIISEQIQVVKDARQNILEQEKENISLNLRKNQVALGCKEKQLLKTELETLKLLSANDVICSLAMANHAIDILTKCLMLAEDDEMLFTAAAKTLARLARNDDIKAKVGSFAKSSVLSLVFHGLEKFISSEPAALALMKLLSTVSLRQPENCNTLFDIGMVDLTVAAMAKHPTNWKLQKECMHMLRNLVSSYKNKHIIDKVMEQGVEELIRKAREMHLETEEAAFAVLRDMNLPYHKLKLTQH